MNRRDVRIGTLQGILITPQDAVGLVVFSHSSANSRISKRNTYLVDRLNHAGFATLLIDLLTEEESQNTELQALAQNVPALAERLGEILDWPLTQPDVAALPVGLFGASFGAAAALHVALERPVRALVLRSAEIGSAAGDLTALRVPIALIVGEKDDRLLVMHQDLALRLPQPSTLAIIPGAGHMFEEDGALDLLANHAVTWFVRYLAPSGWSESPADQSA